MWLVFYTHCCDTFGGKLWSHQWYVCSQGLWGDWWGAMWVLQICTTISSGGLSHLLLDSSCLENSWVDPNLTNFSHNCILAWTLLHPFCDGWGSSIIIYIEVKENLHGKGLLCWLIMQFNALY
jgi:hypothetical protein